jgi:N-acetylglucosaminyldiphosphoundecaprenol N-acetyl-beta-D-mannosaminyltransferase
MSAAASNNPMSSTAPHHSSALGVREIALMGFPISVVTRDGVSNLVMAALSRGEGGWVFTPNLDIMRRIATDQGFADTCRVAEIRTADGRPLLWAAKLKGTPLPMRVAGSDMIWSITERAAKEGRSVYFLGGSEGAAEKCAEVLRAKHPSLKIVGIECPPMGFEKDAAYMDAMRARLREASPDIVFVGLGSPKQDVLIAQLRGLYPRTWFFGIGVTFSFVAGEVKRAPKWMQRVGLEWFHRLCQEPRRLFKRYLVQGLPFLVLFLAQSLRERYSPNASRSEEPISPMKA